VTASAGTCHEGNTNLPRVSDKCSIIGVQRLNYQTLAHNVLYAEMEIQRLAYEVAAMNESLATPEMYTTVESTINVQRYRMTYVPALLFGGLICGFFAAMLTVALIIHSRGSVSSTRFRTVDSLRLLMDAVANIQDDKLCAEAKTWSNEELEE